MATQTRTTGQIYEATCIHLPVELKQQAKCAGINMTATLREALKEKLQTDNNTENKNNPAQPNHEQTGNTASHGGAV
ncbi:type II toxin-antitoxin system CcdA family antitoxin [Methanogenium sp. MK-MG]|uniref:type II toxin-antitoxin system CcdA family antitoxin n=1 Tax=Methanogenium sp. MK-MG TaxID=2599926 RepID=UPI0013EDA701|nr:type II toxin-antitoxin system CcdA family antitoxin [Methanogenium sp. MK-MG]